MRIFLDWKLLLLGVSWGLEIPAVIGPGKFSAYIIHIGPVCCLIKRPL